MALDISVRKDYWRQGLGRRLMEIQENWCRSQGVEKLCLEVDTANLPAIGLYLRQGFTVEGTLRNQVKLPTAPTGTCTSWGSFWMREPLSPDNNPLSLLRHSHNSQKLPSQALVLGNGEAVLLSAYVKDFSAKGGSR